MHSGNVELGQATDWCGRHLLQRAAGAAVHGEEGGRWGPDQFRLVRDLVRLKVAPIHPLLRRSAALGYTRRWWHILSLGAQAVAAGCVLGHDSPLPTPDTDMPLATILSLQSLAEITPESSRLA